MREVKSWRERARTYLGCVRCSGAGGVATAADSDERERERGEAGRKSNENVVNPCDETVGRGFT